MLENNEEEDGGLILDGFVTDFKGKKIVNRF